MQLLAIILAYALERTVTVGKNWHWRRLVLRWQHLEFEHTGLKEWKQNGLGQLVWALIPAFLIAFVVALSGNLLLHFIVGTAAIVLSIQCPQARVAYKEYLDSANAGDAARTAEALRQLRLASGRTDAAPVHDLLVWIHLRQYFAVLLYYVLFGIVGVLVYATLRDMRRPRRTSSINWQRAQFMIDWLPTRVMTFGFLLVGNFSKAAGIWLSSVGNIPGDNFSALTKIAAAAENLEPESSDDVTSTALTTVALLKRNLLLFIVFIAVFTISGWL